MKTQAKNTNLMEVIVASIVLLYDIYYQQQDRLYNHH